MDEWAIVIAILRLIWGLIVLVFKLVRWIVLGVIRLVLPKALPPQLAREVVQVAPAAPLPPPPTVKVDDARRLRLERSLAALERRATELADAAKLERANRRFLDALTGFFPDEAARVRDAMRGEARPGLERAAAALGVVLDEVEALMVQRRDPELRIELGDADRLAEVCYQPVIDFARAKEFPLTTGYPATQLGDFDLSIWTGFIPTSIAPIFLPRDFFERAAWWPALGHEIGHDFLASVRGLEPQLRAELGLTGAWIGAHLMAIGPRGYDPTELPRLFGVWFEELFCDVFGTLMCGPAYVATMMELFAARYDAREVLIVGVDDSGIRYDVHPPRHLRLLAGCAVLEREGLHLEAKRLRAQWEQRHTGERGPDRILFPAGGKLYPVPLELFTPLLERIVDRLVAGPLDALAGFGLAAITGLDFGPHEHAEGQRARDALLRGAVPEVRDPRAVVAGAVLAAIARPQLERTILANARAAIPALGTDDHVPDAYTRGGPVLQIGALRFDRGALVEAIALREILAGPRARSRLRRRL